MMTNVKPYTGPIFDVQAHAIKPSSYDAVANAIYANPALTRDTADIIVHDVSMKLADDLQGAARLDALGQQSVQVVTINTFFPPLPAETLLQAVDDMNVWMAAKTSNNSQLIGIASIPPPPTLAKAAPSSDGETFMEKGIKILRRAITELGLKGVMFASNYDNVFLGDSSFDPYFALAEELAVPIIIHPAVQPVEAPFVNRKNIPTLSGFLDDQRTTLLDLVVAGTYEKYPKVRIIATHLGGGILTSIGRFRALSKRFPTDAWYTDLQGNKRPLPHPIDHYLKRIYYDCNNAEVVDIMHAASVVGSEHLLTGTDFPWTDDSFSRDALGRLEDSIKMKLAFNNAAKLFGHGEISQPASE